MVLYGNKLLNCLDGALNGYLDDCRESALNYENLIFLSCFTNLAEFVSDLVLSEHVEDARSRFLKFIKSCHGPTGQ